MPLWGSRGNILLFYGSLVAMGERGVLESFNIGSGEMVKTNDIL